MGADLTTENASIVEGKDIATNCPVEKLCNGSSKEDWDSGQQMHVMRMIKSSSDNDNESASDIADVDYKVMMAATSSTRGTPKSLAGIGSYLTAKAPLICSAIKNTHGTSRQQTNQPQFTAMLGRPFASRKESLPHTDLVRSPLNTIWSVSAM